MQAGTINPLYCFFTLTYKIYHCIVKGELFKKNQACDYDVRLYFRFIAVGILDHESLFKKFPNRENM